MALDHYGVLVGTLLRHFRDQPDDQGRWFHVHLEVEAPDGLYQCAVDVDSHFSDVGVQWKTFTVPPAAMGPAAGSVAGYHDVARTPAGGVLDYLRHPVLAGRSGCLAFRRRPEPWTSGSNLDAANALEPILVPGRRIVVFGEPFDEGLGMHNIHQNQGDPAGSQWWPQNAIWQDGGTLTVRPDGRFDIFVSKFSSQADATDDDGHPL
jgi:Uncharacterized conserved protein (DUF2278)